MNQKVGETTIDEGGEGGDTLGLLTYLFCVEWIFGQRPGFHVRIGLCTTGLAGSRIFRGLMQWESVQSLNESLQMNEWH